MASTKSSKPKSQASRSASKRTSRSAKKFSLRKFWPRGLRSWLIVSVVLNALLAAGLLLTVSNPTNFTDASAGFSVDIPAGWTRNDEYEVFRATQGNLDDPEAQIFAYGQRNATLGFYDTPKEERDSTLDVVTNQISEGQNQFILSRFELSEFKFTPQRGQKADGTEFIRTHFTAVDNEGQPVEGEHLLLISQGGGVYSIVGFADAAYWPEVSAAINDTVNSFTAP